MQTSGDFPSNNSVTGGASHSAFLSRNLQDLPTQIMVRFSSQTACVDRSVLTAGIPQCQHLFFCRGNQMMCVCVYSAVEKVVSSVACYFYLNLNWEVNNSVFS